MTLTGPFRSGKWAYDLQQAALAFLRDTPPDELERLSEEFAYDIGEKNAVLTAEQFLEMPGIKSRLPAVAW